VITTGLILNLIEFLQPHVTKDKRR